MNTGFRPSFSRRRGQALIVTVLLMIFAAALGATFVTVVSLNLNQTARSSDKDEARLAAENGARFVRFQLENEGLRWRPKTQNALPQPGEATFAAYYSPFEQAQGWATNGVDDGDPNYHSDGFVCYPDPRGAQKETPRFLLKVEKVEDGAWDNLDRSRTGDLRCTVIGRAAKNENAWHQTVIYVRGQNHNPLTSALRTITNWDFANATVPFGQIARISGLNLTLEKGRGEFPATGNVYVLIGDPLSNRGLRGAVVESYVSSTRTLKLAATVSPAPQIGERVEMAGALGTSPLLDWNGNGTFESARENVLTDFAATGTGTSGGVRANGGLLLFGDSRALQLRSSQNALAGSSAAAIRASSGVQFMTFPSAPSLTPALTVAGEYSNASGGARTLNNSLVAASNDANFPGAWAGMNASEKAQLVDDGWNRLANVPSATRQIAPFAPPNIASGGAQNRYRRLSEYSKPASPLDPPTASLYGYGEGIYINNSRDRERVGGGSALREMTQDELRRMWTSQVSSSTLTYLRLGTPSSRTAANRSLEEQHLRGWVGPDEFRARGALVELNADGTISITLDSGDDTATYNLGAAPHKGWRDANGNLLGHATAGSVYRRTFAWPKNGIICAEGNIRIRGTTNNAPRSLTVVSFNNIYIEGSLNAGDKKIALLAKRNVVLNPTRVLERTDDQTLLRTAITASANSPVYALNVYDASAFQSGDWVTLDNNSSNAQEVCIQSVDAANNRLILLPSTPVRSNQPALRPIRAKSDPFNNGEPYTRYNRLDRFGQALQRRFVSPPGASSEIRLALRHSAERRTAVRVPFLNGTNAPATAFLSHKLAANAQTSLIHTTDKNLIVADGATPLDFWSVARPMSPTAKATAYHINWLAGPTASVYAFNGVLRNRTAPGWRYADSSTQLIFNGYGDNPNGAGNLQMPPFYFLASVGNRADATSTSVWPWRPNLKTAGYYDVPMATSVVSTLNGVYSNETASGLRSDVWDNARGDFERVGQFGFNPIHGAVFPETSSTDETEDAATSDQSFYVNYAGSPLVPQSFLLDSRVLDGARSGSNSFALRFNNKIVDGVFRVADYFDSTSNSGNGGRIPYYNLSRLKLENLGFNAQHQIELLAPAQTLDVRAFVYAQEGSWIVIPGDFYDATACAMARIWIATARFRAPSRSRRIVSPQQLQPEIRRRHLRKPERDRSYDGNGERRRRRLDGQSCDGFAFECQLQRPKCARRFSRRPEREQRQLRHDFLRVRRFDRARAFRRRRRLAFADCRCGKRLKSDGNDAVRVLDSAARTGKLQRFGAARVFCALPLRETPSAKGVLKCPRFCVI